MFVHLDEAGTAQSLLQILHVPPSDAYYEGDPGNIGFPRW